MANDGQTKQFGYGEASYDSKTGRFTLPVHIVTKLGDTKLRLTVDPLGRFVELRSEASFQALAGRVLKVAETLHPETAAALLTDYLGMSAEVQVDSMMRVVVPKGMRDPLGDDSDLALVAVGDTVRVWSLERFREAQVEQRKRLASDYSKFVGALLGLNFSAQAAPAESEPVGGE